MVNGPRRFRGVLSRCLALRLGSFSAVMVEDRSGAWLHGNFRYVAHSDWGQYDQISPWMGLAVIAAEDQKFPST